MKFPRFWSLNGRPGNGEQLEADDHFSGAYDYGPGQPAPAYPRDGSQWTKLSALLGSVFRLEPRLSDLPDGTQAFDQNSTSPPPDARVIPVAAGDRRCQGVCSSGGSYGTSAPFRYQGRFLCRDCAVKALEIQNLSPAEQLKALIRHELR